VKGTELLFLVMGLIAGVVIAGGALYFAHAQGVVQKWLTPPPLHRDVSDDHGEHAHDVDQENDHGPEDDDHGHDADAHEDDHPLVKLPASVMEEAGIRIAVAGAGQLRITRSLSGEVLLNPERLAHIVPRVGGIVREVRKRIGDRVEAGEIMAVLESRELAEAKAEYLAAQQRSTVAEANARVNEELRSKGIVADLDFIAAERDVAEARIALRAADIKLHTFGLRHEQLAGIAQQDEEALMIYELKAPFSGRVVERHIALGELVTTESDVFLLADLSTVWVNLTVYPQDLAYVRPGQPVTVRATAVGEAAGTIEYVSPLVEEATRTASARATLANTDGVWRPGLFVTGDVFVEELPAALAIPKSAIQLLDERRVVFVQVDDGFEPRTVQLGREDAAHVEVVAGLQAGERYVSEGAFALKAELGKESFSVHGHAH
jgi:cobalt-zinc-cadmium efflux system membrane fusion protein